MRITLTVVSGPNKGREFDFAAHDTFLVGRSRHAHFRLPVKDRYFSRMHFMMELNPPQCRLIDLGSHNGTFVNGGRVLIADLKDGDQIRAGHTSFRVNVVREASDDASVPFSGSGSFPALPTAGTPPKVLGLADRVAGYHLIQELGKGNMGTTYLGRHEESGKLFAVKIVAPTAEGTLAQAHEFLEQVKVLQDLRHPHVTRLRTAGDQDGVLYFVSDYVKGTDGARRMEEKKPLDVAFVLKVAKQILSALEYAHAKNRIHRDIKPANLLLSEDGDKVRLADFGLAHLFQKSQLSGLTMMQPGSASFMPPEYVTNFHDASPAGDQYSLAATLYYLLTAQPPIESMSDLSGQFSALLEQKAQPILERRPGLAANIAAAIDRALSRDPADRFADVTDFRQALLADV